MPDMNTSHMMILIFAVFLLVPLGIFFLVVSLGNFMYGDTIAGLVFLVVFMACSGAVYFLLKKYRE